MGLGFSLYHSINLIVGYAVPRYGLLGVAAEPKPAAADAGVLLMALSFGLMALVEPSLDDDLDAKPSVNSSGASSAVGETAPAPADNVPTLGRRVSISQALPANPRDIESAINPSRRTLVRSRSAE